MKTILSINPVYNPNPLGSTLNFSQVPGFNINGLLAVINQTKGNIIYAAGQQTTKYASWDNATSIMTLSPDVNTGADSSADKLQCIYCPPEPSNYSVHRRICTAGANSTVVKNTSGTLFSVHLQKLISSEATYLKIFDKNTSPTSTDIPLLTIFCESPILTLPPGGLRFINGISYTITKEYVDNSVIPAVADSSSVQLIYS